MERGLTFSNRSLSGPHGAMAYAPVLSFFVTCPAPLTCLFTFGLPL
jgi:hypothetical protein